MDYHYNDLIVFSINSDVYEALASYKEKHTFRIERGGIIAGIIEPAKTQITLTDFTEPQKRDICLPCFYKRAAYGHQEIMDRLWEESQYTKTYLGEWHTHNQRSPQPSNIDAQNWIRISKRNHNSEWLFFLIVGTEQLGVWTVFDDKIVRMAQIQP